MIESLRAAFSGRLLTADDDIAPFLTDWRKIWKGRAMAVVQPDSTTDVAAVVRWCAKHGVPLVPQGGNTGMSGGATPDANGGSIVLSLARLNRIRSVDTRNGSMTVDAGCILQMIQEEADHHGLFFPLSLAAEGSCTIGGNLATNAGGPGVLRYGNARDLCLGLEVVTADGEIWDGLRGLRKDNSGYDLRDLFIGSEGTLGIITGAVLKLFARPAARMTAILAVERPADAIALFELARGRLGMDLTAFELFSATCLDLVLHHLPTARRPVEGDAPWYVLVELSDLLSEERAGDNLQGLLERAFAGGMVLDGSVATSVAQSRAFWALRETIAEAQGAVGKTIKHDISLPISHIAAFLAEAGEAIGRTDGDLRFVTFGHLGDGNLHYNFSPAPGGDQDAFHARQDRLNRIVHDLVRAHGGSISAEHGLGVLRRDEADRFRSTVERRLMQAIKTALDPQGIMNPGKMLP